MADKTERDVFLAALAKDPYDRDTRLIFSDWLLEHGEDEAAAWQRGWTPERQEGEEYLRGYAERLCEEGRDYGGGRDYTVTFEELLVAAREHADPHNQHWGTLYLPYDTPDFVYQEWDLFWRHYAAYTGQDVPEDSRGGFIRCGC